MTPLHVGNRSTDQNDMDICVPGYGVGPGNWLIEKESKGNTDGEYHSHQYEQS